MSYCELCLRNGEERKDLHVWKERSSRETTLLEAVARAELGDGQMVTLLCPLALSQLFTPPEAMPLLPSLPFYFILLDGGNVFDLHRAVL